jgi:thiamine kinase-like enzyme
MQLLQNMDQRRAAALEVMGARRGAVLTATRMVPSIAMPLHLALDAEPCAVTLADEKEPFGLLKIYETEAAPFVDFSATIAASRQAAKLQLAPALLDSDEASGALLYSWLSPGQWRMARREDLDDESILSAVVGAKRSWNRSPKLANARSPFEAISTYLDTMAAIRLPDGQMLSDLRVVRELQPWIDRIGSAFDAVGVDGGPIHGENTLSNIMLDGAGHVQMVDFDRSVNADPHYDLAGLCLEACGFREDVDRIVEFYLGSPDDAVAARVCLYMAVDDFLWGCWAAIGHFSSPRSGSVEFYKYAQNRFLRCRYWLSRWDIDALARQM